MTRSYVSNGGEVRTVTETVDARGVRVVRDLVDRTRRATWDETAKRWVVGAR